jgi:hypothetical protein
MRVVTCKLFQIDQAQHLFELLRAFSVAAQFAQPHGNVLRRCLPGKKAVVLVDSSHASRANYVASCWFYEA